MKNTTKGYLSAVSAALLWASCGTFGKALFNSGMSPFVLVQTRVTLAALTIALWLALTRPRLLLIRPRDVAYFLLFGGVFMSLMQLAYFMAISKIQVAAAILIQYLAPVLVAVFAMAFWNERASFVKIAALSLSVTGCYLVAGGYDMDLLSMNRPGILWALASAVGFAASTLLGERSMHRHNPWTSLTYALVFSSISLNLVHRPLAIIGQSLGATVWAAIVYIVIFGTLVPFGLYLVAIDTIRSTRTIITSTLEPIAAAFLAFILLGESLSFLQAGGGLMVIAAIILLSLQREKDSLAPEAIRSGSTGRVG